MKTIMKSLSSYLSLHAVSSVYKKIGTQVSDLTISGSIMLYCDFKEYVLNAVSIRYVLFTSFVYALYSF